jgi:hypothetical protein
MGTCKTGGVPHRNTLGLFCWRRSLKIHVEMKRELFTYSYYLNVLIHSCILSLPQCHKYIYVLIICLDAFRNKHILCHVEKE